MALTTVKSDQIQTSVALAGSPTTTTQSASDNSTKIATTAYVETAVANLVDSAPASLNTLDELAAALNDDASFSTTVTNSIATKLPLAGGTMSGALNMGSQNITNAGTVDTGGDITVTKSSARVRAIESGGATTQIASGGATGYVGTYSNDPLQILSNSTAAITIDTSQNITLAGSITVDPSGSGDAILSLTGASGGQTLRVDQNSIRTTTNSDINIFTNGNSGQLYLDHSGSAVGIFTTTPAGQLNVNSASDTVFTISTTNSTADGRINFRNSAGTDAGKIWYLTNQNRMQFYTNGSIAVNIDNAQRVGIGKTASATKLDVENNDSGEFAGRFVNQHSSGYGMLVAGGSNSGQYGFRVTNGAQSLTAFTVRPDGYLEATGASQVRLSLGSTGTAGTNTANWIRGNAGYLQFNSASSGFDWELGGNATMKLNSSGNLGIGGGHNETRRNLGIIGSTPGIHFLDSNVTNLTHEIVGGGNAGLEYSADYQNVGTGYHRFDIGGVERARFEPDGLNLNFVNNSSTMARLRLGRNIYNDAYVFFNSGAGAGDWSLGTDYSDSSKFKLSRYSSPGGGNNVFEAGTNDVVRFFNGVQLGTVNSGNTTSDVLDDYEEGTFSPQMAVEGQGVVTTSNEAGHYIKVGRVVHVTLRCQIGSVTTAASNRAWEFRNLPFNASNYGSSLFTPVSFRLTGLNASHTSGWQGFLFNNTNYGRIEFFNGQNPGNASTYMDGSNCWIQVSYITA